MASLPRVKFSRTACIVVVLLVAAAVVGLRWDPDPEPPTAGDRVLAGVEGDGGEPADWVASLAYAGLRVQTQVGTHVDAADVPATEGSARWVEVSWMLHRDVFLNGVTRWPGADAAKSSEKPSRLELVAGGRTYRLADRIFSASSDGAVTIAVSDIDDLRLRLTSQGRSHPVTRSTDVPMVRTRVQSEPCDARLPDRGNLRFAASCTVSATRARYIAGLGWPARGKDWLVVTEAGRDPSSEVVANWWPGKKSNFYHRDSDGRVDYVATGKPSLRLTVSGADKPTATYGKPELAAATARLELRAYQVPADEDATVRLTYRTRGTPDPRTERLPGSPGQVTADAAGTLTLPAFGPR